MNDKSGSVIAEVSAESSCQEQRTVKSADRVLSLFELLGQNGGHLSHTRIAEHLGIPKSSLSQLIANLLRRDWLAYHHADKTYSIGPMFTRIAQQSAMTTSLADIARPMLEQLSADTGETAALNQLVGYEAETIATVLAKATLLALLHRGDRSPLYSTSYGKVLMAHMDDPTLTAYLSDTPLHARTPRTLQSAEELKLQIAAIRRDGFGYSFEEHSKGVVGTARAVLGANGTCVAALNVAAAAVRYDSAARQVINTALERAATRMQRALSRP